MNMNYPCPCCGYLTFSEKICGTFEICPVCFWEDDNTQSEDPSYEGGANEISLLKARENFSKFGAIKEEFISRIRKPLAEEIPNN